MYKKQIWLISYSRKIVSLWIMWVLIVVLSSCELFNVDEGISAAVKAGDPNMCASLEDEPAGRIDRCYDRVAQKVKDPTICERISGEFRKDDCFSDIAVRLKDWELCNKIVNKDEKNDCLFGVAKSTNDIELCNKIDSLNSSQKNDCLTNVAIWKNDINICLNLKNISNKNDCLSQVAIRKRDFDICDKITSKSEKTSCQVNIAVNSRKPENCKKIENEASRLLCVEQLSVNKNENICEKQTECSINEVCLKWNCIVPECTKEAKYCRGDKLEICQDNRLSTSTCIYGCWNDDCLTKEEKEKIDKENTAKNACDESYLKCSSDIKLEYCLDSVKTEKICEFGCKNGKCKEEEKIELSSIISDMKEKQEFTEVVSGPYMDALDLSIDKEKDSSKKKWLEAYKDFLGKFKEKYSGAVATLEELEKLKKIFIDQYHPSMDIENMNASDILDKWLLDRLSDAVSWLWPFGDKKWREQLEQKQAEEQLKVYKALLERKSDIEFLKQSRLERVWNTMVNMVKDKLESTVKDNAKDIAEAAAWTAFATVWILSEALDTVQDEAKNMMFTGLIKAYNRRRNVLEDENPLKSKFEIHKMTVDAIEDFPYADAKTWVLITKYWNLLANEDCTKEWNSNPLCIDRHAFWVSMQKSYEEINDRKMFDRWLNQMKNDE